jgi:multidrug efflux pump subunit AcrB
VRELAGKFVARMSQDRRLTDVWSGPRPEPTLAVDIDQAKAASLGLDPAEISATLDALLDRAQVSNISISGRALPVRVQIDREGQMDVDALNGLKVRNEKGQMVPLRTVAALRRVDEPSHLERFDLLSAATITASRAGGLTAAEARFVCERLAEEVFPKQRPAEYRLVWLREMPAARAPDTPWLPPAPVAPPSDAVSHPIRRGVAE